MDEVNERRFSRWYYTRQMKIVRRGGVRQTLVLRWKRWTVGEQEERKEREAWYVRKGRKVVMLVEDRMCGECGWYVWVACGVVGDGGVKPEGPRNK